MSDTFQLRLKPGQHPTNAESKEIIIATLEHLAQWKMPSAEAFRNGILGEALITINPMLGMDEEQDLNEMAGYLRRVVNQGHMIDFGFLKNDFLKAESLRSRTAFEAGQLTHPYDDWIATSSWEGGFNGYYFSVNPRNPDKLICVEMYGVRMPPSADVIMVYDIVDLEVRGIGDTIVSPAKLIMPGENTNMASLNARGANSLDPLVTFLKLLNDSSVPVVYVPEQIKLNRHRIKQGKFPIPAHHAVKTHDYVTAFTTHRAAKSGSKGGHHASPIAHSRRGHLRYLSSGKVVSVRDSRVNWRDKEEIHRLFYRIPVKKKPE